MDALGIFWMVLYSAIVIAALVKLKSTSSASKQASKQDKNDDHESHSVKSITEGQERMCDHITLTERTCNECCDSSNEETSSSDYKNGFHHVISSIPCRKLSSQSQQTRR